MFKKSNKYDLFILFPQGLEYLGVYEAMTTMPRKHRQHLIKDICLNMIRFWYMHFCKIIELPVDSTTYSSRLFRFV